MVDEGDPVRLVISAISLLDVSELVGRLPKQGGAAYDPRVLFGIWMFGLWDGERSSRRLEKRCRTDVRYMLLAGGLRPDHATLCRFRRSLGSCLDSLLSQTVSLARDAGLAPMLRASLDGTRLPGAGSQWARMRKEAEEADDDPTEPPEGGPGGRVRSDRDARIQKLATGGYVWGYNAQALVDCEAGIVLAAHVSATAGDASLLAPTLGSCLHVNDELPVEVLADAGYDTPANAEALADCGITGYIACSDPKWIWSQSPDGEPMCPAGVVASRAERLFQRGVEKLRLVVRACPTCCQRRQCGGLAEKSLAFPACIDPMHWVRQRDRAKTEAAREMRLVRSSSVELSFAFIKESMKLRRLLLRGLAGAQTEFCLAAIALNLAILARQLGAKGLEALAIWLFRLLGCIIRPYAPISATLDCQATLDSLIPSSEANRLRLNPA
jgi:transposase